ncbi:MAG: LPXTG cell wall anchor domain-containing protein [Clostridiales bacterium]|nr:LPXTG cell wall anchor domain-containing protein [Clostridiales bacterium]
MHNASFTSPYFIQLPSTITGSVSCGWIKSCKEAVLDITRTDVIPTDTNNYWGLVYVKDEDTANNSTFNKNNSYAITNGGILKDGIEIEDGVLATPVRSGYVFEEWNDSSGNTVTAYAKYSKKKYYAVWTASKYSLSKPGASSSNPDAFTVTTETTSEGTTYTYDLNLGSVVYGSTDTVSAKFVALNNGERENNSVKEVSCSSDVFDVTKVVNGQAIEVDVDPSNLTTGTYTGTIMVTTADGATHDVPVTLTVVPASGTVMSTNGTDLLTFGDTVTFTTTQNGTAVCDSDAFEWDGNVADNGDGTYTYTFTVVKIASAYINAGFSVTDTGGNVIAEGNGGYNLRNSVSLKLTYRGENVTDAVVTLVSMYPQWNSNISLSYDDTTGTYHTGAWDLSNGGSYYQVQITLNNATAELDDVDSNYLDTFIIATDINGEEIGTLVSGGNPTDGENGIVLADIELDTEAPTITYYVYGSQVRVYTDEPIQSFGSFTSRNEKQEWRKTLESGKNYTYTVYDLAGNSTTFTIDRILPSVVIGNENLENGGNYSYTGTQTVSVSDDSGIASVMVNDEKVKLTEDGTFELTVSDADKEYEIVVKDKVGNTTTITVTILLATVEIPESATYEYNGNRKTLTIPVSDAYEVTGDAKLSADETMYTISFTDAGSKSATLTLNYGYVWSDGSTDAKTVTLEITPKSIEKPTETIYTTTYSGKEQSYTFAGSVGSRAYYSETVSGTDAGEYIGQYTLSSKKNYVWEDGTTDSITVMVTIEKALPTVSLSDKVATYTENAISIGDAVVTLVNNESYTGEIIYTYYTDASCEDTYKMDNAPVSAGTYYVKASIAEQENYLAAESNVAVLTIINADFGDTDIVAEGYTGVYDGAAHSIAVTADGATIQYSTDEGDDKTYNAKNPSFTDVGTYMVYYKVSKDNYNDVTGALTVKISAASISGAAVVPAVTSYSYDGLAKTPSVTVTLGGKTLVLGTDYTLSYSNNVNVGTATVTVTGMGNYTGVTSTTFVIEAVDNSSGNNSGSDSSGSSAAATATTTSAASTTASAKTGDTNPVLPLAGTCVAALVLIAVLAVVRRRRHI